MKLQFTTSTSDGFIEGQVIEVATPSPQLKDWLRRGVLIPVKDLDAEVALAPAAVEQAIARRAGHATRSQPTKGKPVKVRTADVVRADAPVVPALCPGGTVVIFGGGPSLTAEDVEACQGRVDAAIGINNAYQLAPWISALYAADSKWWGWHKGAPVYTGLKYSLQADAAQWPGVQVLRNTGDAGLELDPTGLRTGRNGGYQAINLAVHFGAKRILLLGYDMQKGANGETHWHGGHQGRQPAPYAQFLAMFQTIVEPLRTIGVEVVNCTRRTALTTFPRLSLEEALCAR